MATSARPAMARSLIASLVVAVLLIFGPGSYRSWKPVHAQQPSPADATRALAVSGFFEAEGRGDADAAAAEFTANGIFASSASGSPCYRAAPCSDAAGIRAQLDRNIGNHECHSVVELSVMGAVVTGRMEDRNDNLRAIGLEHAILAFLALVPRDRIAYLTIVADVAAGTQPSGTPIPSPTTPCASQSGS